jgi:hypothetical protein
MHAVELPVELRTRIAHAPGFMPASVVVLLVDDSNADIELTLCAPDMPGQDFASLHTTLRDRLQLALVGINNQGIVGVRNGEKANSILVITNNAKYAFKARVTDAICKASQAILSSAEEAECRNVHVLRNRQTLVLVDWREPDDFSPLTYDLTVPAGAILDNERQREKLDELIRAIIDSKFTTDVRREKWGAVRVELQMPNDRMDAKDLREQMRRLLFVISMVVELGTLHANPVVALTRPFLSYVDNESGHTEAPIEY